MLQVIITTDKNVTDKLAAALGFSAEGHYTSFLLLENDEAVGLARLAICDYGDGYRVELKAFGALSGHDSRENLDFFFRTLLFKLSNASNLLFVAGEHPELKQFGFEETDGGYLLLTDRVVFCSSCKH